MPLGPLRGAGPDMSRLTSIFRRRGDETGPGQETESQPAAASGAPTAPETPSFHVRGRLRRRLRYLRRVRELQLRDLGGLVYETYRMSRPREDLVERKVSVLAATDAELRGLEHALDDVRPMLEVREPGIGGQCPRCGEIFGSDARFCSHCGAGLAGEAAAAGSPPAPSATPVGSSVLSHWTATATPSAPGSPGSPGAPAASPATPGAPAGSPATPAPPRPAPGRSLSGPAGPTPASPPGASQAAGPPAAAATPPQAPVPKAPPPSGSQGIASGDPLGQAAPAPPQEPAGALSSGDPLAAKSAAEPKGKPTEPQPAEPQPPEPEAKPTEPGAAEQAPAGDDETVVMPPNEQGGAGGNGADESRPAKARAAGAQDEPE
ncbi:MAG: hypothetical protein ACJ76G_02625 [Solirubrobacterales bacterium]